MSQLSIFRPAGVDDAPRILSFARFAARVKGDKIFDVATRAKLEHHNRVCPACGKVNVRAIELNDPALNRHGAIVPRTATLAGFSCHSCGNTWTV